MTSPLQTQTPPGTDLNSLVAALGNAAERSAEKGAGASDPAAAKDFGAAALAYTQAIMLIVSPKIAPAGPPPGGSQSAAPGGQQPPPPGT